MKKDKQIEVDFMELIKQFYVSGYNHGRKKTQWSGLAEDQKEDHFGYSDDAKEDFKDTLQQLIKGIENGHLYLSTDFRIDLDELKKELL